MEGQVSPLSTFVRKFEDQLLAFNSLYEELRNFSVSQEDFRMKWLRAEEETRHYKNQLQEANQNNSKLESQYHHTTVLLKNEIKVRAQLQNEKKTLEKQLKMTEERVKEIAYSAKQEVKDEIRAKLDGHGRRSFPLSSNQHSHGNWVRSIREPISPSASSASLASLDLAKEKADEEMEISQMRSSRSTARTKRTSEEIIIKTNETPTRKSRREDSMELSGNGRERMVATTTVTIPKEGPITTTSVIETHPGPNQSDQEQDLVTPSTQRVRRVRIADNGEREIFPTAPPQNLLESPRRATRDASPAANGRRSASVPAPPRNTGAAYLRATSSGSRISQRRHNFSQKTIIKSEICAPCGNRIKFGKPALKCADCRATCHVDCKPRMSTYCVPTAQTAASSNKGFAGTVADYAPASAPMIPALIIHCVDEIERRGMNQVALYRMNASEKEIHDLKDQLLRGKGQPQLAQVDIHVVTGALKLFLKTLKEPLITWTLWSCFTNVADMEEEVDVQNQIYSIFPDLPQPNRDTLAYLILHLQRVSETPDCKMTKSSLARVFGPIIIRHSRPDRELEFSLKEVKKQHLTMEKLLEIPSDYWYRFVLEN